MIEVLFLGVGAALPASGQTNASYILRTSDACVLIDCGPAILQQLASVNLSPGAITHLFFTHRHGDHTLGYPMLTLWWSNAAPLDAKQPTVIASALTWQTLEQLVTAAFGFNDAGKLAPQRISLPQADTRISLTPGITLHAVPMVHHAFAPVLGARFEIDGHSFAFTGDTMPTNAVVDLAQSADLLVHDSTYSATLNPEAANGKAGHSTAQWAARHAAMAGAKHLALVHLDVMYQGKEKIFLEEAKREYGGQVSVPVPGTLYSFE